MVIDRTIARQGKEGIEGLNIAVTGDLETFNNRDELKAFILENGGNPVSTMSAKVDYLIMNQFNPNSAKTKKAKELGIEIINENKFNQLAGRIFAVVGTRLVRYCGMESDVRIPEGVTNIGNSAFSVNQSLKSATIPKGVTDIGDYAFYLRQNLLHSSIPDSVTSIGKNAFDACSSLTSAMIPGSVTKIGKWAFYDCPLLTIHAPAGSYAEQYAIENNIPFVAE